MKNLATTICLMIAVLLDCNLAISEEFKTISTRKDVTISFIESTSLKPIQAAAILFAGGDGNIGIDVNNKTVGSDNFLVRTRELFSELGILTITPDAPSDMEYLKNIRNSLDYRTDISFLIKEINNKRTKPIWLIGTTRGSNTIGYHAPGLKIQGVALTANVTEGNSDTILDTDFKKIMVPTLVVHNKSDLCHVSPSWGAEIVFKQLPQTSRKHLLLFDHDGGRGSHGRDCGATTPHGFLGIEKR